MPKLKSILIIRSSDLDIPASYSYYVHDNAAFRSSKPYPLASADEVLTRGEWKPYTGDTMEPVVFGRCVDKMTAQRFDSR